MYRLASRMLAGAALILLLPFTASAQTSTIAGEVRDTSGAVLPGVTIEVASPALIERTREAISDGSGQYKIISLRPGIYTVTFTLPGFNTVKRENVELTSDFTATINADMKVGAIEETISVVAESPVVDVQSITTRTVMTREVLESMPTGRNIQAVGIMIPGTSISVGGGGALSRDVGGFGNLQQSPLQYRGSADTVQTIEGMRLNNLCANGAYSGVYWNQGSFEEFSYVTGADSAEMAQGGMRVNMVPKDGGNRFRGQIFGNWAAESWVSDNCGSPGVGQPCSHSNLFGDTTYFANNALTNVSVGTQNYDFNPSIGGPIVQDKAWFYFSYRYLAVSKTVADSFFDANPDPLLYTADTSRPGIDDGHIRSYAGRVSAQLSSKDKVSYYHDEQDKVRDHWGISSTISPEASAIQATPTSFVSVTKWTRTQTNRLLFDAGLAVYNQEYQENYQPGVFAGSFPAVTYTDTVSGKTQNAWNNPADHFSKLFTESFAVNYVSGSHQLRFGGTISQGRWRLTQQYTHDVMPVTFNGINAATGRVNAASVTLRLPTDRSNNIDTDLGLYAQDRWTVKRLSINAGVRFDLFRTSTVAGTLPAGSFNAAKEYPECADGISNLNAGCAGRVLNWKDVSPRIGISYDVFGTGRTAVKVSFARYVNGVGLAAGSTTDNNNPQVTVGTSDVRVWHDDDGNNSPFDAAGNVVMSELNPSTSTSFGRNVPSTLTTDPRVLEGWGARGYNNEFTISVSHELAPRVSINGGWYKRSFGNQTVTVDNRFSFANGSYEGPFCVNAPANPNLTNGGNYQVCGLYDLFQSAVTNAGPERRTLTFSQDYGGETNIYQGYDLTLIARPRNGMMLQGGINAQKRIFDQCNLVDAGILAYVITAATQVSEIFPNGERACHQDLPYRPDFKLLGSYTLPFDILLSATYQFSRGVQTGGAAPSIQATWAAPNSAFTLGHAFSQNATTKSVNLMQVGADYGPDNLSQLDLSLGKRVRMGSTRLRLSLDAYNVFNSDWPFVRSATFSTSTTASTWLRPANVLQSRFFKVGATFDF